MRVFQRRCRRNGIPLRRSISGALQSPAGIAPTLPLWPTEARRQQRTFFGSTADSAATSSVNLPRGEGARRHYSFWPVFLAGPLSVTLFACTAGAVIGWVVARLHPTHAVTMVCRFSVSVLLFELGFTGLLLSTQSHAPMPQAALMIPVVLAMGTDADWT
jgi:hypothetical protein